MLEDYQSDCEPSNADAFKHLQTFLKDAASHDVVPNS